MNMQFSDYPTAFDEKNKIIFHIQQFHL